MLEISEIVMYEFWINHVKPKYGEKANLCYMYTGSFIVYLKTEDLCSDITKDAETGFDTSSYELDRTFLKRQVKKKIGLIKHKLGGKIMKEIAALRAKT